MEKEIYTVDFKNVKGYYDMHRIFKESMEFPHYYGHNLDALWDCLTDLWWHGVEIRIYHFEDLQKADAQEAAMVYKILCRLKHCYEDCVNTASIFIECNGVTEEIK